MSAAAAEGRAAKESASATVWVEEAPLEAKMRKMSL